MMNGAGSTATCHNPACSGPMETSTRSGRPRKYCSDTCRRAYYRAGAARRTSPDAERHDQYVQQILDELGQRVDRLRDLAHADRTGLTGADSLRSQTLALLKGSAEISKDIQDLDAAIAQQARDRGVKVVDIAKARNISADKVSRDWPADGIDRRMNQRQQRRTSSSPHGNADTYDLAHEALYLPGRYLPGEELEPGLSGHGHDLTEGPPPPRRSPHAWASCPGGGPHRDSVALEQRRRHTITRHQLPGERPVVHRTPPARRAARHQQGLRTACVPRRRQCAPGTVHELRRHIAPGVLDDPCRPVEHIVPVTAHQLRWAPWCREAARDLRAEGHDVAAGHGLLDLRRRLVTAVEPAGHSAKTGADQDRFHSARLAGDGPRQSPRRQSAAAGR